MANNAKKRALANTESAPAPAFSRPERILGVMAVTLVVFAVAAIIALAIGENSGVAKGNLWASISLVPDIALPLAFIFILILLVSNLVRRSRAARDAGK